MCRRAGLFIIDTEGVLRQIIVNDIGVGRSVDEVMRLVQAYQFVDIHGEGEASPCSRARDLGPVPEHEG